MSDPSPGCRELVSYRNLDMFHGDLKFSLGFFNFLFECPNFLLKKHTFLFCGVCCYWWITFISHLQAQHKTGR